jgi:hypothetical protein
MEKIYIGIDYSRISPAVTIIKGDTISFHAFPREGNIKDSYKDNLELAGVKVNVLHKIDAYTNLENMESSYSYDAELLAMSVINAIKKILEFEVSYELSIALEGLSFASTGSSSLTYAGYHFILRYLLSKELQIKYENIHIIAPGTLKKTAGKGNFKKDEMIGAFITCDYFKETKFQANLVHRPELFQSPKAKHWVKPVDDICDASYAALWLWQKDNLKIEETPKTKKTTRRDK